MRGLEQARQRYRQALDSAIEDIAVQLAEIPEVRRAVLFGSAAAGRRDLFTDLDVLVVIDSEDDFVTRTARLRQRLHAGVDLDLVAYTPDELERMADYGFVRHALQHGKVIYERERA